jgi:hypothetical protein
MQDLSHIGPGSFCKLVKIFPGVIASLGNTVSKSGISYWKAI